MDAMISIRRLIASFLAGALILVAGAASASADGVTSLDRARSGLSLGLQAVSDIVDVESGSVVLDEGLARAMSTLESLQEAHDRDNPGKSEDVHAMLLEGEIPGRLNAASKLASISNAFADLRDRPTVGSDREKGPKSDRSNRPPLPDQAKRP